MADTNQQAWLKYICRSCDMDMLYLSTSSRWRQKNCSRSKQCLCNFLKLLLLLKSKYLEQINNGYLNEFWSTGYLLSFFIFKAIFGILIDGIHCFSCFIENFLDESQYRPFWMSWNKGHVKVGQGLNPHDESTVFMEWRDLDPLTNITTMYAATHVTGKYIFHGIKSNFPIPYLTFTMYIKDYKCSRGNEMKKSCVLK